MRYLKTSEAAALLNVSPNTLRAWERRFGFPKPQRSPGKHRLFTHGEVAALRDALQEGLSISSAISRAREGLAADANSLVGALASYESERADAAIEAALALRSVERSVEEVLLPTLDEIDNPSWRASRSAATSPCVNSLCLPGERCGLGKPKRRSHARRVFGLTLRSAAASLVLR